MRSHFELTDEERSALRCLTTEELDAVAEQLLGQARAQLEALLLQEIALQGAMASSAAATPPGPAVALRSPLASATLPPPIPSAVLPPPIPSAALPPPIPSAALPAPIPSAALPAPIPLAVLPPPTASAPEAPPSPPSGERPDAPASPGDEEQQWAAALARARAADAAANARPRSIWSAGDKRRSVVATLGGRALMWRRAAH